MSDFIVLAPTLGQTSDADPIEDVLFLRDNDGGAGVGGRADR